MARLGRDRTRRLLDAEPGQPLAAGRRAAARHRRLGARLLPALPEQTARLPERMVGRRQLGRGRTTLRRGTRRLSLRVPRSIISLGVAPGDGRTDRAEET